jgi:hypothetical protein
MGYGIVPDLTTEAVAFQKPCQYKDCEANRKEWTNAKCCTPNLASKNTLEPGLAIRYPHTICKH